MRLYTIVRICVLVAVFAVVMPLAVQAAQAEVSLISSMEARLPSLMDLKLAGKLGETNLALAEVRTDLERAERKVLSAENCDRSA
ncbi:MAG: hypothetical protein ACN4GF_04705 [Lentimonas sp.]